MSQNEVNDAAAATEIEKVRTNTERHKKGCLALQRTLFPIGLVFS